MSLMAGMGDLTGGVASTGMGAKRPSRRIIAPPPAGAARETAGPG
jgi:hypothetical protein